MTDQFVVLLLLINLFGHIGLSTLHSNFALPYTGYKRVLFWLKCNNVLIEYRRNIISQKARFLKIYRFSIVGIQIVLLKSPDNESLVVNYVNIQFFIVRTTVLPYFLKKGPERERYFFVPIVGPEMYYFKRY